MPMVPMFQGGVPQAADNGSSGMQIAQLPQPTFDYARTMEAANRTLQDNLNNVAKAMQTEAARNVKAESDQAEIQVMQIIQQHTIGENGYFNQQGENAAKGYQGAWEGLNKDVDDVYAQLSPWAQQAVKSRLQERMISVQGRMQQWQAQQAQAWHIGESKSRIDALTQDAAENYQDKDYVARTCQSIDDEITYIAKQQGLGEEQTKQLRQGYWDALQAQRYDRWAQDNPTVALTDFQRNRGAISSDVADKIAHQLWQQAKRPLAMMLGDSFGGQLLDKKDFIRASLKPGHKTGIPAIDGLNQAQKVELYSFAYSYAAQNRQTAQTDLRGAIRTSLARAADQGFDAQKLTLEDFKNSFGEANGPQLYADYKASFDTSAAVYSYRFLDNGQIQKDLENSKPSIDSPTYADDKKLYQARVKAAQDVIKARAADPVGTAVVTKQFGFEPVQWDVPTQAAAQLAHRVTQAQSMSQAWGTPPRLLSKDESTQLVTALDKMDVDQQVAMLTNIADAVGPQGIGMVADQLKKGDRKYAIAMAGFGTPVGDGGATAGELYLLGLQKIAEKQVKEDQMAVTGAVARLQEAIGDERGGTKGLFPSDAVREDTVELARGVYAYKMWQGDMNVDSAVEAAVGGKVAVRNGKKFILPRGVSDDATLSVDMSELLGNVAADLRKGKQSFLVGGSAPTGTWLAANLPKLQLQTQQTNSDGSVEYSLIANGEPVLNEDRTLYTFTLAKPAGDRSDMPFYQYKNLGLKYESESTWSEE